MSEKIDVTPEALDQFASMLSIFCNDLEDRFSSLRGHLSSLGDDWKDPAYIRWESGFEETVKAIREFQEESEDHLNYLKRKAEALKEARNIRF